MPALSFVLAATLRDLRRTGVLGVGGILLGAVAVLVAGATLAGLEGFGRLTAAWRAELRIVATLGEASSAVSGSEALVATVRAVPGVRSVRYVSTREALADLRRYLGSSGNGLDRLPVNPVPARIEVTPSAGLRAASLRELVETLEQLPGVEEVQAAIAWVGETERLERALRLGGFGLAAALGVTTSLVVAGATVLARQRRADETAVLPLVGTGLWAPLLLQALTLGGAGAALGLSVLLLGSEGSTPWIAGWLPSALGLAPLPTPSGRMTAALFGVGVALGLAGGLGGAVRWGRPAGRLVAALVPFAVGAGLVVGAWAGPKERPVSGDTLRAKKEALGEVRRQLDQARARATAARTREVSLLAELEEMDRTLVKKRGELRRLDRRIVRLEAELVGLEGRRGQVAEDTVALQGVLAARLRALERLRHAPAPPGWLVADRDVARARALDDVGRVARLDLERLVSFTETAERLTTRRDTVTRGRRELVELRRAVEVERSTVNEQADRRRTLLAQVRDDRATHERMAAELEDASRRLEALVRDLARRAQARVRSRPTVVRPSDPVSPPATGPRAPAVGLGALRGQLRWPIEGRVVAPFGRQIHPRFGTETFRNGVDIEAEEGALIRAVYGGTVLYRGWLKGYGNLIILDHGQGYYTLYAHASELLVEEGDSVKAGQGIARVGETASLGGPLLYFEVRYHGRPEDPQQWLKRRS